VIDRIAQTSQSDRYLFTAKRHIFGLIGRFQCNFANVVVKMFLVHFTGVFSFAVVISALSRRNKLILHIKILPTICFFLQRKEKIQNAFTDIGIDFFGEHFQLLRRKLSQEIVDVKVVVFLLSFFISLCGCHGVV
jgi:hypothetical protein